MCIIFSHAKFILKSCLVCYLCILVINNSDPLATQCWADVGPVHQN